MKGRILKSAAALALVLGLGGVARAEDCQVTVGVVKADRTGGRVWAGGREIGRDGVP
jgi:hypothetical protein